jgi:sulfopyruvate decarboxylase subunit beta
MKRFDCLTALAAVADDPLIVTSAGAMTLEWNYLRRGDGNFRVRTLGLCSSIALGMALGLPQRRVIALDGDGSLLMNLSSLPTIARMGPKNLIHIVFDNEVYEASGSKKTATGAGTDLVGVARAAGIKNALWANSLGDFANAVAAAMRVMSYVSSAQRFPRSALKYRRTRLMRWKTSIVSSAMWKGPLE